jgi:hypothetical protein
MKGEAPFKRVNVFTLFRVYLFVRKLVHPSRRVHHSSKRVNGRVRRGNHPSKGEWGFSKYTLAEVSVQFLKIKLENLKGLVIL